MDNDQLSRIERCVAVDAPLTAHDAHALLMQLRKNAAEMVLVKKRLADALRALPSKGGDNG